MLDKGRFSEAYELAYKHCTRGRAPSEKQLDRFVAAYAAIQASDEARASSLQRAPGTEKWASLYETYDDLYNRSVDILNILPSAARFDRYPDLAPAHLEQLRENARKKAGSHYLVLVGELLQAVRALEKPAAREAHSLHKRIAYFLPERNAEFAALRDSFVDIGTLRILLYTPGGEFASELQDVLPLLKPIRSDWTEILSRQNGKRIDLEAELVFDYSSDSGEDERCSTTEHDKEILDYIEKKEVEVRINDTTVVIQTVEIKHYKKVYASVTECKQTRSVCAYGRLDVYLPGLDDPEWRTPVSGTNSWSNKYSYGSGDARALPSFSNSGRARSSPSHSYMLSNAVTKLPSAALWQLKKRYAPKAKKSRKSGNWLTRR